MRALQIILLLCLAVMGCKGPDAQSPQTELGLIPRPVSAKLLTDSFLLSDKVIISIDNISETLNIAGRLQHFLQRSTGYPLPIGNSHDSVPTIHLSINKEADDVIGSEGYRLTVEPRQVIVKANQPAGLFYGIQTLMQLLPEEMEDSARTSIRQWKIPCVDITDYPRFKWRGIMLDVSRHFFPLSDIKKLIDEMARYKFNTLHLHLTDDNGWRIEIKSLPELTKTGAWRVNRTAWWGTREAPKPGEVAGYGGFYTQEEIKELVSFAKERSVNILPEIDVPGHCLAAIASYNNLSCTKSIYRVNPGSPFYGVDDNALCVGNDSTYAFLDKVFTEIAALFPYPYIHVGGDETYKEFWKACPACKATMQKEKLPNTAALQAYFFNRLKKILDTKGKKMIGWDEMLDGGFTGASTVMNWRTDARTAEIIRAGQYVVATPQEFTYLDHYQADPVTEKPSFDMLRLKKVYAYEPVPAGSPERAILGGQANLWSEFVPDFKHAEYMLWPRALALAEIFWSLRGQKNWSDFVQRTLHHLQRLKFAGINYSTGFNDAIVQVLKNDKGKIGIRLDTEIDSLRLYYSFGDKDPDTRSSEYKKGEIISFPEGAAFFRVVTYKDNTPAGRVIVLPLYELEKRITENKPGS